MEKQKQLPKPKKGAKKKVSPTPAKPTSQPVTTKIIGGRPDDRNKG